MYNFEDNVYDNNDVLPSLGYLKCVRHQGFWGTAKRFCCLDLKGAGSVTTNFGPVSDFVECIVDKSTMLPVSKTPKCIKFGCEINFLCTFERRRGMTSNASQWRRDVKHVLIQLYVILAYTFTYATCVLMTTFHTTYCFLLLWKKNLVEDVEYLFL